MSFLFVYRAKCTEYFAKTWIPADDVKAWTCQYLLSGMQAKTRQKPYQQKEVRSIWREWIKSSSWWFICHVLTRNSFLPILDLDLCFHTANLKISNGFCVFTVCCGNHWVLKFLDFRVNKAVQKIKLASNVMGRKIKVAATKNLFQHPYSHYIFTDWPKAHKFWGHHTLIVSFFPLTCCSPCLMI